MFAYTNTLGENVLRQRAPEFSYNTTRTQAKATAKIKNPISVSRVPKEKEEHRYTGRINSQYSCGRNWGYYYTVLRLSRWLNFVGDGGCARCLGTDSGGECHSG